MVQKNYCYSQVTAMAIEASRSATLPSAQTSDGSFTALSEGHALIDASKSSENYELFAHHKCLDAAWSGINDNGKAIAEIHKSITGRSARMNMRYFYNILNAANIAVP